MRRLVTVLLVLVTAAHAEEPPPPLCRPPVKSAPMLSKLEADRFVWDAFDYFACIEAYKRNQEAALAWHGDGAERLRHQNAIDAADAEVREFKRRYWK